MPEIDVLNSYINSNIQKKVYSVSEINNSVKQILETGYSDIWVQGEVSNAKLHTSGHFYFTLKDENARLNAVMFKFCYQGLRFKPENGLKVIVYGKLTCFVKAGSYQINCVSIEPKGQGALQLAYEQLKKRLEKEGLFDKDKKKKIPMLPQRIGIVTSETGAAIKDILTVINRRYANIEILLYPVSVQGENAKYEISEAIRYLNDNYTELDVLLVGRGGGSIEDLWAFNEEIVARAIFASEVPVISCVGHEIDFVISDFVADMRAPTPSAAAELVVQNKKDIEQKIEYFYTKMQNRMHYLYHSCLNLLQEITKQKIFVDPYSIISERAQNIDYYTDKLNTVLKFSVDKKIHKLDILKEKLEGLSPLNILRKGYIVVRSESNIMIKSIHSIKVDDVISLEFRDGKAKCRVEEKI